MSLGIDCASHAPSVSALHAAKVQFVCRYVSGRYRTDRAEVDRLRKGGLEFVSILELAANRSLGGKAVGILDASAHLIIARMLGAPAGATLYFCANDWDATESDQPRINAYFQGIGQELGKSRVGAYGSYWVLKRLFDAGLIGYGWQTTAWSGGKWDPRVHIRQTGHGATIGGVQVDFDTSMKPDFGQWRTTATKPHPGPVWVDPRMPDTPKPGRNIFQYWNPFKGSWWRFRR